jgi:hypothetical protein
MSSGIHSFGDGRRHFFRLFDRRRHRFFMHRLFDSHRGRCRLRGFYKSRGSKRRCGGFRRLRFLSGSRRLLRSRPRSRPLGEHIAARQRNAALAREALDELPRDDLFDGA